MKLLQWNFATEIRSAALKLILVMESIENFRWRILRESSWKVQQFNIMAKIVRRYDSLK